MYFKIYKNIKNVIIPQKMFVVCLFVCLFVLDQINAALVSIKDFPTQSFLMVV